MRTTLLIDDDALEAARRLAAARNQPLGEVVSELIRRGLAARRGRTSVEHSLTAFRIAEDSPLFALDDVKRDEDEPH